jgi:predicted O-methyltransferase YrrM
VSPGAGLVGFARTLLSYLRPQELDRRRTEHNPLLRVVEVQGRRRLDAVSVNYSRGSLERVLAETFDRLELDRRDLRSVLLLGFGAGSAVVLLRQSHGAGVRFTAVEIDPVVIELARRWFQHARDPGIEFVCRGAREHVEVAAGEHDLVLVDAFVDERIPAELQEPGFARGLARCIAPGGLLVFNTLADGITRRAESDRIEAALRTVFGSVRALDVRTNRVLVWEREGPTAA